MKKCLPRVIIAGVRGGAGKTTLSLGLISALRKRGLDIAPYKKGPDYIDAGWLASAAQKQCYNLDPFMLPREKIIFSFEQHFNNADCAVIEGNRGLYDGMDAQGTASTAELAKLLKSPVLVIMDCTKITRTAGALLYGLKNFDKKVDLAGIVLNQIAGARHERIIRETVEQYCKVPVLGAIPKLKEDFLAERHMGLTPFQEHPEVSDALSFAAALAEKYIDVSRILKIARNASLFEIPATRTDTTRKTVKDAGCPCVTIGIIRDSAFQFYYPENFEELTKRGARLVEISALTEKKLPDLDALYIGGGFPETHAIALARNTSFRQSVLQAVEAGLPVYAECGGLMYLGRAIVLGSRTYPMTGVFPVTFSLEKRPQAHGYTIAEVKWSNPFFPKGTILKGHEFHYSKIMHPKDKGSMHFGFSMKRGQGITAGKDGIWYNNAFATYTHLHAYGSPEWADAMIRRAMKFRVEKARSVSQRTNHSGIRKKRP